MNDDVRNLSIGTLQQLILDDIQRNRNICRVSLPHCTLLMWVGVIRMFQ